LLFQDDFIHDIEISISDFKSGIYFIIITDDKSGIRTEKLLVQSYNST